MCTAQVLLLSRDVMRRNFGGGDVNRSVCRKLFETNDSNSVDASMFLRKMEDEIRKKDTERWNFDFVRETPLPGRFQWEPVFAGTSSNKKTPSTESEREGRAAQVAAEPIVDEIRRKAPTPLKRKRKDAGVVSHKITEYMTKKKKCSTEEKSSKLKVKKINSRNESLTTTTRLR